jgi:DNA-binding transcriptional MocR family regulator
VTPGQAPYAQIVEHYEQLIVSGELEPGSLLPSIKSICQEQGVSHATAEKALRELRTRGLVRGIHGIGTEVLDQVRGRGGAAVRGLDQHITGNWGEDSVAPEFCRAEELGDFEASARVRIDVAPQTADRVIAATITSVAITAGFVHVKTEEFAFPFIIPMDEHVFFADDEDET